MFGRCGLSLEIALKCDLINTRTKKWIGEERSSQLVQPFLGLTSDLAQPLRGGSSTMATLRFWDLSVLAQILTLFSL